VNCDGPDTSACISTDVVNGADAALDEVTVTTHPDASDAPPPIPDPILQQFDTDSWQQALQQLAQESYEQVSKALEQALAQSQNPACTKYPRQAAFVNANLPDATQIANQLNTSPGNILGLAGFESGWGGGPLISAGTNNYFSLKAGPAFATGATGSYQYGVNTFWTYSGPGMLASGNAFAQSYFGARVNGATSPQDFAASLNAGGKYNGSPSYNATLVSTINQANAVMGCP
jgi:flagellum-specific peptidoglycan hydrolase FlgJ